jgi:hypothetical protein
MSRDLPPTSAFANDDGGPDPGVAACLLRFASGSATVADVVSALQGTRVIVPILAMAAHGGPPAPDGAEPAVLSDRHASAGVVAVAAPDGRTALPVFTSVATLGRWHAEARPMPAESARAAAAAVDEGWILVLDPGGPVTVLVPRPAVRALATGTTWVPAVLDGDVRPEVRDAVAAALAGCPSVVAADAVPGARAEVAVVLAVRVGLSRVELDALLADVGGRLAADPATTASVDSLELRVRPAGA